MTHGLTFLLASLVLAATPGPGVGYIVTRTLTQGRRAGWLSVAGVAVGNLANAWAATLGLATLFALWPATFTVVKLAGACYLLWLAWTALARGAGATYDAHPSPSAPRHVFRDGALVALLNPKTALFFAAFLPTFAPSGEALAKTGFVAGALFVGLAACTDAAYVWGAQAVAGALGSRPWMRSLSRYAGAAVYTALAVVTARATAP